MPDKCPINHKIHASLLSFYNMKNAIYRKYIEGAFYATPGAPLSPEEIYCCASIKQNISGEKIDIISCLEYKMRDYNEITVWLNSVKS